MRVGQRSGWQIDHSLKFSDICHQARNDIRPNSVVLASYMPRTTPKKPKPKARPVKAKPVANSLIEPKATPSATETTDYTVGDEVTHPLFGDGTVTAVDGKKLTIKFSDGRVKLIISSFVKRRPH